jgi:hypothetical protein
MFLFTVPGCSRVGTGRSGPQVCFLFVRSPVLVSAMLIEAFNCVPLSLDSSVSSRPRPLHILSNMPFTVMLLSYNIKPVKLTSN